MFFGVVVGVGSGYFQFSYWVGGFLLVGGLFFHLVGSFWVGSGMVVLVDYINCYFSGCTFEGGYVRLYFFYFR